MAEIFKIDTTEVQRVFSLSKKEHNDFRDFVVARVSERFVRDVTSMASRELGRTRGDYIRSISMTKGGIGSVIIELGGFLANAIEQGYPAFDQKEGFQRSPKAKQKLDGGWYITIPFSHATPGTAGDFATLGEAMPEAVYEQALSLTPGEGLSDDGSLPRIGERQPVSNELRHFDSYMRKHSPYEGMQRIQREKHTSYVTFRRVSDKSDDLAWIHAGFEPRRFFDKALSVERLAHEVDIARDTFINRL